MTASRERSDSSAPVSKRLKTSHIAHGELDATHNFASGLLHEQNAHVLKGAYKNSTPFKHVVVDKLFQDDLLVKVKDECLGELCFTEKETDIYKVHQTGDLASLSYLDESQRTRLQNLETLRNSLYSPAFRTFIRNVTGCGPLSGTKTDMSVNTYRKGCHLLNHDDVIGTRRVSYILYMPLPKFQGWRPEWGGALELYPVKTGANGVEEPEPIPVKSIPPSWNQFIFFEVQPGKSFHSVQEVVVGNEDDGRERLSISGWFHAAQEGEEGYEPETHPPETKSSLEQLTSASTSFNPYPDTAEPPLPSDAVSEAHIAFLSEYLNPVYLQQRTLEALTARFTEESSLELHSFLCEPLAKKLQTELREQDSSDQLGASRQDLIPSHAAGSHSEWEIKGPPHKFRYCILSDSTATADGTTPHETDSTSNDVLRDLQNKLFPSEAFRAWLAHVSNLVPMRYAVEARRFRPALDYTLATSDDSEARLDVVLGLTPPGMSSNKGKQKEGDETSGWESGEWGGWECYMAPHEGDEDPAVYRSGSSKKPERSEDPVKNGDSKDGDDEDMDADEDGTLLTVQPGFNRLLLVLRDEKVMHFVKYVSSSAQGSRWDVCGEYEVGMVDDDDAED